MLNEALHKTDERAHDLLQRWCRDQSTVWVYFATHGGGVSSSLLARIAEVTRCLVFTNDSTILRVDLKNATLRCGPLHGLLTPSRLGRAAVLTHKRSGLVARDGVIITVDSRHSLFICESTKDEPKALELAGLGGMLGD